MGKERDLGGRPRKLDRYQIEQAWKEYKDKCDTAIRYEVSAGKVLSVPSPKVYTLGAFLSYLKLSREAWGDYRTYDDDGISDTVKTIDDEILSRKEEALVNAEGSTTGVIFDLKCNHKWQDKQVIESKVELNSVEVIVKSAESLVIPTSEADVDIEK